MHTRLRAAKIAAGICVVFGLAVVAAPPDAARAADDAPVSRTPLADTGLWTPPVLNSTEYAEYLDIPEDEGLAAFYGIYKPMGRNSANYYKQIEVGAQDIYFFGITENLVRDRTVQYKILHQDRNYILIKYRRFSHGRVSKKHGYTKHVGFAVLAFPKKPRSETEFYLEISKCEPDVFNLFASDDFNQPPERDAADIIENRYGPVDAVMREGFAKGKLWCHGGSDSFYFLERLAGK